MTTLLLIAVAAAVLTAGIVAALLGFWKTDDSVNEAAMRIQAPVLNRVPFFGGQWPEPSSNPLLYSSKAVEVFAESLTKPAGTGSVKLDMSVKFGIGILPSAMLKGRIEPDQVPFVGPSRRRAAVAFGEETP